MNLLHVGVNEAEGYFLLRDGTGRCGPAAERGWTGWKIARWIHAPASPESWYLPSGIAPTDPATYGPKTLQSLRERQGRLPLAECLRISVALTDALEFLHRHGLIHRDIKPANIIFVGGVPKLADVGTVTHVSEARTMVGTDGFRAPEGPANRRPTSSASAKSSTKFPPAKTASVSPSR
jgi:hypothetical protein